MGNRLIIIGFVAGIIAKFLHPGSNEPAGFILTTALGIAGAFVRPISARRSAGTAPMRARPDRCRGWRHHRAGDMELLRAPQRVDLNSGVT